MPLRSGDRPQVTHTELPDVVFTGPQFSQPGRSQISEPPWRLNETFAKRQRISPHLQVFYRQVLSNGNESTFPYLQADTYMTARLVEFGCGHPINPAPSFLTLSPTKVKLSSEVSDRTAWRSRPRCYHLGQKDPHEDADIGFR